MNTIQPLGLLVGRILLALIFIGSGFSKITGFADTAASIAAKGMPMVEVLFDYRSSSSSWAAACCSPSATKPARRRSRSSCS